MRGRTITFTVTDKRGKTSKTIPLYQYDYGQKLVFEGVELPEYYEVHFSNEMYGEAVTVLGDSTGVLIPDTLLATGEPIYVWLFLHDSSYDGETEYQGVIPIIKRAEPTDVTPTPEEQSIITEVIAALNNMEDDMSEQVEAAETARDAAETAQAAAESAATTASSASDAAGTAQTGAETAQTAAETAQAAAEAAQTAAESAYANADDARAAAVNAKTAAEAAQTAAESASSTASSASGTATNAASSAETYKTDAQTAKTAAETAQGLAETAQTAAEAAEDNAEASALVAEGYAVGKQDGEAVSSGTYYQNNAAYYAGEASDSATAAASSESDAEDAASDAEAYAVGKRGGVDVSSDDPAYHNNAKYYSDSMIGKADMVANAVEGNFAGLDDDGNLVDSGSKPSDFLTEHQDISGKLDAPLAAGTEGQVLTSDGEGGQTWADPSGAIDDTAGEGDTDVTWSADKLTDEFGDVLSDIHGLSDTFNQVIQREKYANLFNKDGDIEDKKYISKSDGSLVSFNNSAVQYIPFEGEGDYSLLYPTDIFGTTTPKAWLYNSEKEVLQSVSVTLDSNSNPNTTGHFSVSASDSVNVAYIGFTFLKNVASSAMFVKGSTYPSEYIPYGYGDYEFVGEVPAENVKGLEEYVFPVPPEKTTFIEKIISANLFDKNGNKESGKLLSLSDGSLTNLASCSTQYIPFEGEGTYCCFYPANQYGKANVKLCLFNEEKTFIKTVTGTLLSDPTSSTAQPASFAISSADSVGVAYFGYSYNNSNADTAMFVKASTYPEVYAPYSSAYTLSGNIQAGKNPLYNKTAVFDGDSICANATDAADKGAYSGRIGTNNDMEIKNYAVTGATITSGTYYPGGSARHWVSGNIDTIYANYPNADYIIFEGGANDADVIGNILDSQNIPAGYGSWTEDDFSGEYDDETFCGAVETIIFKAMSYWPKSKIGFVIVMKMGSGNTRKNYYAYLKTIMDICDKWGVPYVNLWDNCPINPSLVSCWDSTKTSEQNIEEGKMYQDGQHPTPTGYDRIYPIIEEWMRTL